jgi:L-arabinose isomerase
MTESRKARLGLLGLMIDDYLRWPEIKPGLARFGDELVATLAPFAEVEFPGVLTTRAEVDEAVARFEAGGADLIVVVLLAYAPSHIALPALLRTRLPVLLFNTQQLPAITAETRAAQTTLNHGMHGAQDLANVLRRAGRPFYIVTGHYCDPHTLAEVKEWCDAARMLATLRHMRIGLIGYPMEGMGDFAVDETALLAQAGVQVHHLAMRTVAERARAAPAGEIAEQMADDRVRFQCQDEIRPEEHEASLRLGWALSAIMREQGLQGFAYHFGAVGEEAALETLPFLAAARLLGEGYGFGGEGDVTSATGVSLLQALAGPANFTEMFSMDFAGGAILMMHMGEGNWRMARHDEPVRLLRSNQGMADMRFEPLLLAFSLEPGPATLLSLTTVEGGRLKFIAGEGEVLDFPYIPDLRRPHYKFRPAGELGKFLTNYLAEGGSHHQALAYGHWAGTIEKLAGLLGIAYAQVS